MEWTAAIARAVINPRHGVYEAQDGAFHGKNSSAA